MNMKTYIVYLGIGLLLLSACTRDSQSDEEPSLDTTQTQPIDETKPPQSAEQSQKDLQLAEQEFDKANQELLSNMDKLQQTGERFLSLVKCGGASFRTPSNHPRRILY